MMCNARAGIPHDSPREDQFDNRAPVLQCIYQWLVPVGLSFALSSIIRTVNGLLPTMKFLASLLAFPFALAAPVIESRDDAPLIPERWIAVFHDDVLSNQVESILTKVTSHLQGSKPDTVWDFDGFKGFAFGGSDGLVSTLVSAISEVSFIEQDAVGFRPL